jgi:hypothetical protein
MSELDREAQLAHALAEAVMYLGLLGVSNQVPPEMRQRWYDLLVTEERHFEDDVHESLRHRWTQALAAEAQNYHYNAVFLGGPLTPRLEPFPPQVPPEEHRG